MINSVRIVRRFRLWRLALLSACLRELFMSDKPLQWILQTRALFLFHKHAKDKTNYMVFEYRLDTVEETKR